MAEKYMTVKLSLSQIGPGRYRSRIEQSPLGASKGTGNDFDLTDEQLKADRDFAHELVRGKYTGREIEEFGQRLFKYLFDGSVVTHYNKCLGAAASTQGVRLRLALAIRVENLIPLPWEYMHDGEGFLLRQGQAIVRIIEGLRERQAPFSPIQKLLVAVANPASKKYHHFDEESHLLELKERIGKLPNVQPDWLIPATRKELMNKLRDNSYDAFYFLGHGNFNEVLGGQIILEKAATKSAAAAPGGKRKAGKEDPLNADILAQWLSNSPGSERVPFVYLNSCSTAATGEVNTFTGVAQRLMRDGEVAAVVAMQAPVEQKAGIAIAEGFFEEIKRGLSPEGAILLARDRSHDSYSWGVPVVYSYLSGPEEFEKNQIAALLSANVGRSSYGLFLPTFRRGIPTDAYEQVKIAHDPPDTYSYKGESFSRRDTQAAWCVLDLVSRIAEHDQIGKYTAYDHERADCSHWFLFGSKSNDLVNSILHRANKNFEFEYQRDKWTLKDLEYKKPYTIDDPSQMSSGKYAETKDYGAIEKIIDKNTGRFFFLFSGLGDRATHGCGWYFLRHWEELLREYGNGEFGIILTFPEGLGFKFAERINRETGQPESARGAS